MAKADPSDFVPAVTDLAALRATVADDLTQLAATVDSTRGRVSNSLISFGEGQMQALGYVLNLIDGKVLNRDKAQELIEEAAKEAKAIAMMVASVTGGNSAVGHA